MKKVLGITCGVIVAAVTFIVGAIVVIALSVDEEDLL